jgi:hypothetical protein
MSTSSSEISGTFDFEEWSQLYASDPEAFERKRAAALEAVIAGAPAETQKRLRGVQFTLDMERSRAGSDLAACLKAHTMMWDSLTRLRDALARLSTAESSGGQSGVLAAIDAPVRSATILAFPARPLHSPQE